MTLTIIATTGTGTVTLIGACHNVRPLLSYIPGIINRVPRAVHAGHRRLMACALPGNLSALVLTNYNEENRI